MIHRNNNNNNNTNNKNNRFNKLNRFNDIVTLAVIFLVVFLDEINVSSSYSLLNKKAVVTGSSGGIGSAIAKALAAQGARVLVHYHTRFEGAKETNAHIQRTGGCCDGIIQSDFNDPENVCELMSIVDKVWGGQIDILINNAGIVTKLAAEDEEETTPSWLDTMQINLNAPYQLSKLAHERMKNQSPQGGVIINISSIHGSNGNSVENMVAYAASKAGMDRMTEGLSNEWAKDGVRVNAVAPGVVPVERTQHMFQTRKAQDMWYPHLPLGRMGTVEDVADAVLFLCESEWMSGTILTIDGGMSARGNMPFRPKPKPERIDRGRGGAGGGSLSQSRRSSSNNRLSSSSSRALQPNQERANTLYRSQEQQLNQETFYNDERSPSRANTLFQSQQQSNQETSFYDNREAQEQTQSNTTPYRSQPKPETRDRDTATLPSNAPFRTFRGTGQNAPKANQDLIDGRRRNPSRSSSSSLPNQKKTFVAGTTSSNTPFQSSKTKRETAYNEGSSTKPSAFRSQTNQDTFNDRKAGTTTQQSNTNTPFRSFYDEGTEIGTSQQQSNTNTPFRPQSNQEPLFDERTVTQPNTTPFRSQPKKEEPFDGRKETQPDTWFHSLPKRDTYDTPFRSQQKDTTGGVQSQSNTSFRSQQQQQQPPKKEEPFDGRKETQPDTWYNAKPKQDTYDREDFTQQQSTNTSFRSQGKQQPEPYDDGTGSDPDPWLYSQPQPDSYYEDGSQSNTSFRSQQKPEN